MESLFFRSVFQTGAIMLPFRKNAILSFIRTKFIRNKLFWQMKVRWPRPKSLIFLPAALIKNVHMVPPEGSLSYIFKNFNLSKLSGVNYLSGFQIRVFSIAFCYIIATMASFQAFTMIAPGAALGARCSSRTFFAILLSFFCLKEKILKLEIFSVSSQKIKVPEKALKRPKMSDRPIWSEIESVRNNWAWIPGPVLYAWSGLIRGWLDVEKHECR